MIIKSIKNSEKEPISINQLYFVIKYKESKNNSEKMFYIFDDCRTLSWIKADCFSIENDSLKNYEKESDDDMLCFTYSEFNDEFFIDFYMENDLSVNAVNKLEKIIIDVMAEELSSEIIMENLDELGFHMTDIEYQLKAFFKIASKDEVIILVNNLYNKFSSMDEYLYDIIVENIVLYKGTEIDNLLSEMIMSPLCSEQTKAKISDYWTSAS